MDHGCQKNQWTMVVRRNKRGRTMVVRRIKGGSRPEVFSVFSGNIRLERAKTSFEFLQVLKRAFRIVLMGVVTLPGSKVMPITSSQRNPGVFCVISGKCSQGFSKIHKGPWQFQKHSKSFLLAQNFIMTHSKPKNTKVNYSNIISTRELTKCSWELYKISV